MDTIPKKLLDVPRISWANARKEQLEVEKLVEKMRQERRKEMAAGKALLSPLGQRPELDADHLLFPMDRER